MDIAIHHVRREAKEMSAGNGEARVHVSPSPRPSVIWTRVVMAKSYLSCGDEQERIAGEDVPNAFEDLFGPCDVAQAGETHAGRGTEKDRRGLVPAGGYLCEGLLQARPKVIVQSLEMLLEIGYGFEFDCTAWLERIGDHQWGKWTDIELIH